MLRPISIQAARGQIMSATEIHERVVAESELTLPKGTSEQMSEVATERFPKIKTRWCFGQAKDRSISLIFLNQSRATISPRRGKIWRNQSAVECSFFVTTGRLRESSASRDVYAGRKGSYELDTSDFCVRRYKGEPR